MKLEWYEKIRNGDTRALAKAISLIENNDPQKNKYLASLFKVETKCSVIGITGSPGSGKSTIVDTLALKIVNSDKKAKVAILAIDPTSPFTGGAILGDRIRMSLAAENERIFIRSMATRGAMGGLTRATQDVIVLLKAAGFDYVIIETVGVGQVEVDVVETVDTCLVVLVPGMGDSVQTFKAGIIEIADIFVVNKSDREGADLVVKDLNLLLSLKDYEKDDWKPSVEKTVGITGLGIDGLIKQIDLHRKWIKETEVGANKQRRLLRNIIKRLYIESKLESFLVANDKKISNFVEKCLTKELDPYTAIEKL